MPRDILPDPIFEVRVARSQEQGGGLDVIRTEPKQFPDESAQVKEGETPPMVERQVPLNRDDALRIYSERASGRTPSEDEGVFKCLIRENGVVLHEDRESIEPAPTAAPEPPAHEAASEPLPVEEGTEH